jgi:fructose-1,6-bisphosphatase I
MNPNRSFSTLDEFTIQQSRTFEKSTGELSTLLRDIGLAGKLINKKISKAGLLDILGAHGAINVQGEEQMKLDVFANDILINVLKNSADCAGIASEENDEIVIFDDEFSRKSKYVVLFDPLDGSSNIDVNASIGTIFCIYKRLTPIGENCNEADFLQKGRQIMASGYIIYGSSTMMVYATKLGVNGFTLEPSIGEFCLSHANMKCPEDGKIYSLNQGNTNKLEDKMKDYLQYCMQIDEATNRPYTHRYIGSMIADIHRTLIKGGIFMYPNEKGNTKGKLRILYECNPMAHLIEMAGGTAISHQEPILDIKPKELHMRVPIFIGSKNMVAKVKEYL